MGAQAPTPKAPPPSRSRVVFVLRGVSHSGSRKEVLKWIGKRKFGRSSSGVRGIRGSGPPARAARRAPGIAAISIRARNLNHSCRGFGSRYGDRGIGIGSIRARGAPRGPGGRLPESRVPPRRSVQTLACLSISLPLSESHYGFTPSARTRSGSWREGELWGRPSRAQSPPPPHLAYH